MGLRSALKAFFQTGDKPTAAQYVDLIDSMAHTTEDYDKMGGGLKEHVTTRPYKAGEAILVNGKIRISNFNQTGAYNQDNWTDYTGDAKSLGIPAWTPEEEITEPVQRIHRNVIYEAIDVSTGIEPGVDPEWESYWVAVVYTEGGLIPILTSGFVKFDRVYEYTGEDAPKGLYRSIAFEGGYDGGYKLSLSNFATDLAADKWALVAPREAGGGPGVATLIHFSVDVPSSLILSGGQIDIPQLPAVAGKAWVINSAVWSYRYGSTTYTETARIYILPPGGYPQFFLPPVQITAAESFTKLMNRYNDEFPDDLHNTILTNTKMVVEVATENLNGDGEFTVSGTAYLIDL